MLSKKIVLEANQKDEMLGYSSVVIDCNVNNKYVKGSQMKLGGPLKGNQYNEMSIGITIGNTQFPQSAVERW